MRASAGPSTTQRGLGHQHQRARKAALAALRDGDPCARCEQRGVYHPMYRAAASLLDLDDFPGRMFGGPQVKRLSYRACNRSHGAALGNRTRGFTLRAATTAGAHTICRACGQPYSRAARTCQICGSHYHPTRSVQHTCSRACGAEYRRRKAA